MEEKRYTYRSDTEKKSLTNRLNRIEGQIGGIRKMIEEERYCDDILIQLQAVNKSIKSLANVLLENHMYKCVTEEFEKGNTDIIEEVISLFRRFQ